MHSRISHLGYRPDIDGLRAVSVLAVVAYHAFPQQFRGGFIGVDVFFVISGYLISSILFKNLNEGTFSLSDFYGRRIKRIFPSLLVVLLSSYCFGWFTLFADEFKQLGKHIAGGAGFISNFLFWKEAGYFDNSGETKPLLHLWSLGIEEQFYIFWPVFLWVFWRKKGLVRWLTVLLGVISFGLNLKGVHRDPTSTFYFPQTRLWELLIGSGLAWSVSQRFFNFKDSRVSDFLSGLGLALLAFGFCRIDQDLDFPGKWALVPTLGATLIIAAGTNCWINRQVLSNRVFVWFGLISFPLYLWHWPILSFARIIELGEPSSKMRIVGVLIAVFLAWITYRFIEQPIRCGKVRLVTSQFLVLSMTGLLLLGYYTFIESGFSFRTKDKESFIGTFENSFPDWKYFKKTSLNAEWRSECAFFDGKKYFEEGKVGGEVRNSKPVSQIDPTCYQRDPKFTKSVLIWGDSHAQSLSPGIVKLIPENWQVLQVASSACPADPMIEAPSSESQCDQSNYFAMKTIRETIPNVVVIAQKDGHDVLRMNQIAKSLKKIGVEKILFVGPTPQWTAELPKIFARRLWRDKPRRTSTGIDYEVMQSNQTLLREFKEVRGAEYVDVMELFCNQEGCLVYTDDDFVDSMTAWDYGHLTPSASQYLAKHLLIDRIVAN